VKKSIEKLSTRAQNVICNILADVPYTQISPRRFCKKLDETISEQPTDMRRYRGTHLTFLKSLRNCGKKTVAEILTWLGEKTHTCVCRDCGRNFP